jgi:electron transport complex protein RnfG
MAKLRSTLPNMIMSLTFISLGMAAALGYVYTTTKGPIEQANQQKVVDAIAKVVPSFNNDPTQEVIKVADGKDTLYLYPAKKDGELVGMAVKSYTLKGFSGYVRLMVGFLPDGTINNTQVLEQKETPGLGTQMMEAKFKDQFNGKNPTEFKLQVKKDGGDVDAITSATISSRAYCDAIKKAYKAFLENSGLSPDSAAGAEETLELESADVLKEILPAYNNDPLQDTLTIDGLGLFVGRKGDKACGIAVKSYAEGYNGNIWLLVAFTPDGNICAIKVLKQTETKGRGTLACEEEYLSQFIGKNAATGNFKLSDEGGEIDAISASTISSNAVCKAVERACKAFRKGEVK